ncbi:MAG: porin [Nitrosomonadales bacterium]|nr:porin [Nitrosomonadales bacterium]
MMQKKLIVVALATAIALPVPALADNANVTIYGLANLSFDMTNNGNTAAAQGASTNKVSSNASRLGFKGAEDLGDGLSAVWQVESRVDMDNAGGTFATRNTFAGLKGESWGQLILGRHDTPYKIATRRLDIFGDSMGDNRALMGGAVKGKNSALQFDGRPNDIVMYTSPSMNGFTVAASYIAGAELATASTNIKGQTWSLAGMYDSGPLFASLAYQANDVGGTATGNNAGTAAAGTAGVKESAWKAGAGYKLEAFEAGLAYERTSDNFNTAGSVYTCTSGSTATDCYGHNTWYLSGKYKLPNDAIKLAYAKAGDLGNKVSTGASQWMLGYDHNLSKRTTLYAIYTKLTNSANASYGVAGGDAGINTGFVNAKGADADPSAWSLGVKHSF